MYQGDERRENYPTPEKELYDIKDIDSFIEKERRHDELDRMREVQVQKRTWNRTVLFCFILNLVFLLLGVVGLYMGY